MRIRYQSSIFYDTSNFDKPRSYRSKMRIASMRSIGHKQDVLQHQVLSRIWIDNVPVLYGDLAFFRAHNEKVSTSVINIPCAHPHQDYGDTYVQVSGFALRS